MAPSISRSIGKTLARDAIQYAICAGHVINSKNHAVVMAEIELSNSEIEKRSCGTDADRSTLL